MPRTRKTRAGAADDALQQFVVFDRLEVGSVRLELRRMAPSSFPQAA